MAHSDSSVDAIEAIGSRFQAAPGTEILYDTDGKADTHLHDLQHATHGDSRILLVPQPSLTDPNDPLRWSQAKKWITLLNGCWYAFMGSVTGPIMAAGEAFKHRFSRAMSLTLMQAWWD